LLFGVVTIVIITAYSIIVAKDIISI